MKYIFMHKNIPVADLEFDDETYVITKISAVHAPKHIPVGIGFSKGVVSRAELNQWWQSRSIPASRSGLREALEILDISVPTELLTKCFGLSLSDQYWIKPGNLDITWNDVNFFENPFSEDVGMALFGRKPESEEMSLISPDNTSDGCLKKKWLISEGKRCLMKAGSPPFHQEPYNEALATEIMKRLEIPHTEYQIIWENDIPYSICEDFVNPQTELVSANYIRKTLKKENNVSDFSHFLSCCEKLGIPNADDFLNQMFLVDYITANTDRHYGNFGALRNAETLEWIGFAPIYDCGTSMWHQQLTEQINYNADVESKPFRSKHSQQIKLISCENIDLNMLNGISGYFSELLKETQYIDERRRTLLCKALETRIDMIGEMTQRQDSRLSM